MFYKYTEHIFFNEIFFPTLENNFVKNFGGIGGILRYPIIKYEDYEDYEDFF